MFKITWKDCGFMSGTCCFGTLYIIGLIISSIFALISFIIGGIYFDESCDDIALMSLGTWLVVLGVMFFVYLILMGIIFITGIIYIGSADEYNETRRNKRKQRVKTTVLLVTLFKILAINFGWSIILLHIAYSQIPNCIDIIPAVYKFAVVVSIYKIVAGIIQLFAMLFLACLKDSYTD